MSEKFIGYFRLVDACPHGGCPVCRCVEEDGRRHLEALMYEQVNDPGTRHRLRASWGFCSWHTWMLLEVPDAPTGAAILHEDLIGTLLHRVERLRDQTRAAPSLWQRLRRRRRRPALVELHRRRQPCPVCVRCAEAEPRYLLAFLEFIDDPQFARAYAKSDGICVPHTISALELAIGTVGVTRLIDRTLATWKDLRRDLDRFVAKHDYRSREPFTDAEASSYRRAFEMLSGRRGVWGNHVHGLAAGVGAPARGRSRVVTGDASPREADALERGKLGLRVRELTEELNETMSRATALHYRLAQVAEDRNALELNLSGERAANKLAMRTIADLRAENERLRTELGLARGAPLAGPPQEA